MENNFEKDVCPACGIMDRFGDKWSLRILVLLYKHEVMRFNEILKNVPGISQKMLTTTLRTLESHKLISRKMYAEIPPRVEYRLTSLGNSLMEPLNILINWTIDHTDEILSSLPKTKKTRS